MSSFWNRVVKFFGREAKEVGEILDSAKDKLDDELTRRERELEMTPSEKIEAITQAGDVQDENFERIIEKADRRSAEITAERELRERESVLDRIDPVTDPQSDSDTEDTATDNPITKDKSATPIEQGADSATDNSPDSDDNSSDNGHSDSEHGDSKHGERGPVKAVRHEKTMGEIKYERARAAADDLLEELRDELDIED